MCVCVCVCLRLFWVNKITTSLTHHVIKARGDQSTSLDPGLTDFPPSQKCANFVRVATPRMQRNVDDWRHSSVLMVLFWYQRRRRISVKIVIFQGHRGIDPWVPTYSHWCTAIILWSMQLGTRRSFRFDSRQCIWCLTGRQHVRHFVYKIQLMTVVKDSPLHSIWRSSVSPRCLYVIPLYMDELCSSL